MPITLRMTFQPYGTTAPYVIEVPSVSFDGEQTLNIGSQSSGAGAGKVVFNPFSFTKKPDTYSPEFFARLCSGTAWQKVSLDATSPGAATSFFTFTMGLVAIKTLSFSASEGGAYPEETITLEYGQAVYSVAPQNPDGSLGKAVLSGWDRVKNVSLADPTRLGII